MLLGRFRGTEGAIRAVPAILGIALFAAALVAGAIPGSAWRRMREPIC